MTSGPPPITVRAVIEEAAWLTRAFLSRIHATLDNLVRRSTGRSR
jgi:hypothetical protein